MCFKLSIAVTYCECLIFSSLTACNDPQSDATELKATSKESNLKIDLYKKHDR